MKNNIALIGMMGAGKTTVAEELSRVFPEYNLVDIDREIERTSGKKISELFLKFGEAHFRVLESDKIKKFIAKSHQIIALGGGAFENEENRKNIKDNCTVIYLKASAQAIYDRIKLEFHRPLLRRNFSIERINEIMQMREKNYNKADLTFNTDDKTPEEITFEIVGALKIGNN